MGKHNATVFLEPRGFIKALQLIFALVSLFVLETYRGKGDVRISDNSTGIVNITDYIFEVEYPFANFDYSFAPKSLNVFGTGEYRPHARLYIAVSVLTFLYVLLATPCYVLLEIRLGEKERKYFYHSDFVVTAVFAFLWFVASCVWAVGATGVPDVVDDVFVKFMAERGCYNSTSLMCVSSKPTYGGIAVAVVLGFVNCVLWCGGGWFTFKETHWFRPTQQEQEHAQSDGQQEGDDVDVAQFKYKRSIDGELDGDGELELPQTESDKTESDKATPAEVEVNVPPS